MPTVSRHDRYVDLAALLVLLIGIALYLDSNARFHAIMALSYRHPGPRGISQLAVADRARYEAYAALGLTIAGCVVGAVSAARHALRGRVSRSPSFPRSPAPTPLPPVPR